MPPRIPLTRPALGDDARRAADRVLASGWLVAGEQVQAFERELGPWAGAARRVVATSSGTTALVLALTLLDIGPGDEVVVPSYSFVATAAAACHVGATPVFCDLAPGRDTLDPAEVARRIGPATKAVVVVDQFGTPADWPALEALARAHELGLIADAACALGATTGGRPAAARGDVATWSFHPRKLVTTGEGGALVVPPSLEAAARQLVDHGRDASRRVVRLGHNARMTDLGAAIGRPQLGRLPDELAARQRQAARYASGLDGTSARPPIAVGRPSYQSYALRVPADRRDPALAALRAAGVEAVGGLPPIHREPAFADWAPPGGLPETDRAWRETLILPIHGRLQDAEQAHVIETLRRSLL